MRFLLIFSFLSLTGCFSSLPLYQDSAVDTVAKIKFKDVSKGWYPMGKSLKVEIYNGCISSNNYRTGGDENVLGRLTVKETEMDSKDFIIPANEQLYFWIEVPGGCGGPVSLLAKEDHKYEALIKSYNNVQCGINVVEIVDGKSVPAEGSQLVKKVDFFGSDQRYAWRHCNHLDKFK